MDLTTWSVQARNLPEHAANPIHTDEGGRAAGFDAALVAGVTVYAYVTRPSSRHGALDGWPRAGRWWSSSHRCKPVIRSTACLRPRREQDRSR